MKNPTITAKAVSLLPALPAFWETYRLLKKSQWWRRQQLEEYQLRQLSRLLTHAYENVPYYKKLFNEYGLKPADIKDLRDLPKIPFLTKEIIRDNLKEMVATNYPPPKLEYVTTGGSTGIPLGIYYERGVSRAREWAFIKTLWERVGYHFRDKCVVLRGNVVKGAENGRLSEKSLFGRWLILSSYHMTDANLPGYVERIRKFKPKFIQAYPSAITILARFIKENNIKPFPSLKAILCGSENLYSWQREMLEEAFRCRVYSWYGHVEMAALAGECEKSADYHIFPEYGVVELMGKNNRPVTGAGKIGEIIGTSLTNYASPLIRYRTMDTAIYSTTKCSCGRDYPRLQRVEGRLQELLITRNGRLISMTAINMHSDVFDNVAQFQFYQDKKEEVVFNIVRRPSYTDRDTEYIRRELERKLGEDIDLVIRFVDHIPRTPMGKYNFLVQKLHLTLGEAEK